MQKKKVLAENRRPNLQPEPVPDLTDFMNDWFYGSANAAPQTYDLTGGGVEREEDEDAKNSNSRLTQDWLEEAKRMVAMSPSRNDLPSRLVGSPRFAAVKGSYSPSSLDRRDPLSRSARRHRAVESFSGEILSKSAKHNRNKSENVDIPPNAEKSPASAVHQWFSNILKLDHPNPKQQQQHQQQQEEEESFEDLDRDRDPSPTARMRPPRQTLRKSRFQESDASASDSPTDGKSILSRRTFRAPAAELEESRVLSPPKNLVESAHRRSISSSTCSVVRSGGDVGSKDHQVVGRLRAVEGDVGPLNLFLRKQRARIERISRGESFSRTTIVLSGSNPNGMCSTMVAAICYAWLLENKKQEQGVVVPVMNMKRGRMWKQKQAAWLFHHVGIDAAALLFSDEVELENLIMSRQLSVLVVGKDVLKTNGEVGSECTVLTDNYCEDAYDLLQTSYLKKLLLAGILLDTQNLNLATKISTNRDAEAVQLLLVGSASGHKHVFYDQLTHDQQDNSFLGAMQSSYGKLSTTGDEENEAMMKNRVSVRKSISKTHQEINRRTSDTNPGDMKITKTKEVSPKSDKQSQPTASATKQDTEPSRGKNKFFLAKWFGFGSK